MAGMSYAQIVNTRNRMLSQNIQMTVSAAPLMDLL